MIYVPPCNINACPLLSCCACSNTVIIRRNQDASRALLSSMGIAAIDLFCGAGGLTRGLELEGITVKAGIDVDPACKYPYNFNTWSTFIERDITKVRQKELQAHWGSESFRLLAGCAPCQPFSTYTQSQVAASDPRWGLLHQFSRLVQTTKPHLVTMENVVTVSRHRAYSHFCKKLVSAGYTLSENIVDCQMYGIPQKRRRLVLFASLFGIVRMITPDEFGLSPSTVRDAISHLPALENGQRDPIDPLHKSSSLSPVNLKRIRASKPGGSWADWDPTLMAACHEREKGKSYRAVYGRMEWDYPAPTITTQSFGFGSGRFGHPEQDRALSLREAALLQTFPAGYRFVPPGVDPPIKTIGRLIGNAVPVRLGRIVGRSLTNHVRDQVGPLDPSSRVESHYA